MSIALPAHGLPVLARRRRPELVAPEQLGLSWLLTLRWGAVVGQATALVLAWALLELALPYTLLFALVVFTAITNAALTHWGTSSPHPRRLPAVLALDVVVLTTLLAASGAAGNPFTVFYLVHIALAALLLEEHLAWSLVALTVVCFAALFFVPAHVVHAHEPWRLHLTGMWIAYVLAASFVAHFVGRVSRAMRDRDRRLAEIASLSAQNERLASLSSFSANAAHELGSPLATIGLAAKELAIGIRRDPSSTTLESDAELICREVARCREILAGLSARAGESVGEMPVRTTLQRVVDELRGSMAPALVERLRVSFDDDAAALGETLVVPVKTLAQMLHNLVRNAFDAHEDAGIDGSVELRIEASRQLCFHVLDRGAGFAPEVRAQLGEPFVTTKLERGGLGLGVYLARAYAERTGGYLLVQTRAGGGTDVELCLARDALWGDA